MMTESEFDNLLVRQKDLILRRVNEGTVESLEIALAQLAVIKELWETHTYGYKCREIYSRILKILLDKGENAR